MTQANEANYCMRCGSRLEKRELFGSLRPACPACGWIYFEDPKVAAAVIVEEGDQVLLVRRVNEPFRGYWAIPAGFVDAREDPALAAKRECMEETGLEVEISGLDQVIYGREHPHGADFVLVYRARIIGGHMAPGDDADQVGFFQRSSLPPLAFNATRKALGLSG